MRHVENRRTINSIKEEYTDRQINTVRERKKKKHNRDRNISLVEKYLLYKDADCRLH